MEPRGLLCDEITSALDPELKHEVLGVLEELKADGLALIVVTHELGFARRSADRIVVLDGGRVIEDGPPAQVFEQPQTERTGGFSSRYWRDAKPSLGQEHGGQENRRFAIFYPLCPLIHRETRTSECVAPETTLPGVAVKRTNANRRRYRPALNQTRSGTTRGPRTRKADLGVGRCRSSSCV